jgi:hypothetical protein
MLYMQSTSSATGQMKLTLHFDPDPDTAETPVNNRVSITLPQLPDTVRNAGGKAKKRCHEQYIGNYANLYILDALKRVPGPNQASIMDLPDLAMRLWLQPDRMASLGLTASDIQAAVSVVTEGRFTEPKQATFGAMRGGWVETAEASANEVDCPNAETVDANGVFTTPVTQPGAVKQTRSSFRRDCFVAAVFAMAGARQRPTTPCIIASAAKQSRSG